MKKIKFALFLIFVIFFGLVVYQNLPFLVSRHAFIFDIKLMDFYTYHHTFPEFENGLYFLGSFFIGLIVAYISLLKLLFKSRKTVKGLNQNLLDKDKEIGDLKKSLANKESVLPAEKAPEASEASA